ncbi:MAG: hypothetical protein HQ582_06625 [Planctomycetes bacterium]|nr:hypothetical protein [Planctomycetota bacterium]
MTVGLEIAGALLVFATWVVLVIRLSGWSALARRYRCDQQPEGKLYHSQTVRMTHVRSNWWPFSVYVSSVNICIAAKGVHFSLSTLLRLGHPPLLIPWSDLRRLGGRRFMFWRFIRFSVGNPPIANITIPALPIERDSRAHNTDFS